MKARFNNKLRLQIKESFKNIDRAKLVKALKSSENTVDQIANGLLIVSPKRAVVIETLTGGKVPAVVLRPDIFKKPEKVKSA